MDQFADAELSQLQEEMLNAADLDKQANREKLPVTLKPKVSPKVMDTPRKCILCLPTFVTILSFYYFAGVLSGNLSSTITFWKVAVMAGAVTQQITPILEDTKRILRHLVYAGPWHGCSQGVQTRSHCVILHQV